MGGGSSKKEEKEVKGEVVSISNPHEKISSYPNLEGYNNILAKCLTPDVWLKLNKKESTSGYSLEKLIQVGLSNRYNSTCNVGVFCGDEECYTIFADLLDRVIEVYHNDYLPTAVHHPCIDVSKLHGGEHMDSDYVLSCRVSVVRSLRGFRHPPFCTRAETRDIRDIFYQALQKLSHPFSGKYYTIREIPDVLQHQLSMDPMLCDLVTCPSLKTAGYARDWPDGRAIWINQEHSFIVWLNDKEHIRIIWREPVGNIRKAFEQAYAALENIEELIAEEGHLFQHSEHLGYISSCPTKLGTGMSAELHMRLPYIKDNENYQQILNKFSMKGRCDCMRKHGKDTNVDNITVYLSNKDSLGKTEIEIIQHVIEASQKIIDIDKRLYQQECNMEIEEVDLSDLLPIVPDYPTGSFPNLRRHQNWLVECLTPDLYWELMEQSTDSGFTLDQCIQTGVDNLTDPFIKPIGAVAGDEDTYTIFSDLMDKIIYKYHRGYTKDSKHTTNFDCSLLKNAASLDTKYVVSCRVRIARNLHGFCLPPQCTRAERAVVELAGFETLDIIESIKGTYVELKSMSSENEEDLIKSNLLMKKPEAKLNTCARMTRDWPQHRGVYISEDKNFALWINEKDHYRFISTEQGGNILKVCERLSVILDDFEQTLLQQSEELMWNEHLGYITTCPSQLGTGMKATVSIKLPKLSKNDKFDAVMELLRLQKRDVGGPDTEAQDELFDISCVPCLGVSEIEQVQQLVDGVQTLIQMEKRCEKKKSIEDLIPKQLSSGGGDGCKNDIVLSEVKSSNYPYLHGNPTVMAKILSQELYDELQFLTTKSGCSLDDCIQSGVDYKKSKSNSNDTVVGIVAGDENSYQTFTKLFDRIISDLHNGYKSDQKHPTSMQSKKLKGASNVEPDYVVFSTITVVRCIRPYSLAPRISRQERRDVESVLLKVLRKLPQEYQGQYTRVCDKEWNELDWSFDKPRDSVEMSRDWPEARGVWHNDGDTFCVFINPQDHIKFIYNSEGSNMKALFDTFCDSQKKIEATLKKCGHEFMYNKHLGYIQTCPSRLGTGLHVGVDVRLPRLVDDVSYSSSLDSLQLVDEPCPERNYYLDDEDLIHISNKCVLGVSEVEITQKVVDGVHKLVELEKKLENDELLDDSVQ